MSPAHTVLTALAFALALWAAPTAAYAAEPGRPKICDDAMNATHEKSADSGALLALWDGCLATNALSSGEKATAFCNRGIILHRLGRMAEAMASFDQSIVLAPNYPCPYASRAMVLARGGKDIEAALDLESAIRLDGSDPSLRNRIARHYISMKQYARAVDHLDALVRLNPGSGDAHHLRGWLLASLGRYRSSLKDYDRVLELDPKARAARGERGIVLVELGEHAKALADLDEAISRGDADAVLYCNRGYAHQHLGDWGAALRDFTEGLRLKPESPGIMNNIAWVRAVSPDASLLDGQKAVELAEKATDAEPRPDAQDTLAAAYARAGRYAEAVRVQTKVVQALEAKGSASGFLRKAQGRLELYRSEKPFTETTP